MNERSGGRVEGKDIRKREGGKGRWRNGAVFSEESLIDRGQCGEHQE